ncbi:hypothetical protein Q0Z83_029260 [Actinoplanes sichuanensis]|uniref:Uncharacterized protein n=1 Tax=Actinoplanes sichuanensis TaxID=512349 RepID=A0ABW4AWU5_9ACTN|nr:hypothetical protein [Actinoplanes sichuanensis]BEL04735.1 hypothetical protein Q0Z83_029260 [Actinoplanes sichuanensis]
MEPLRDVFAGLAGTGGDPGDFLRELPAELVAEAVAGFAETAPLEVAEHLAPFVGAHFDTGDAGGTWLDLLASAPVPEEAAGLEDQDLGFGTGSAEAVDDMRLFDVHDDGIDLGVDDEPTSAVEHGLDGPGGDDTAEAWVDFGADDDADGEPDDDADLPG